MMTHDSSNPYVSPRLPDLDETQSVVVASIHKWTAVIVSLVATVPVGLAVNLILFAVAPELVSDGIERTAYYWAASSVLASLICSFVVTWLTPSRLAWYHFLITYELGWLAYFLMDGTRSHNYGELANAIYRSAPFVIPAIVAASASVFRSPRRYPTFANISKSRDVR